MTAQCRRWRRCSSAPDFRCPLAASRRTPSPAVMVGTPTAHPADLVQVLLRRDAGPPIVIRALREATGAADPAQWFRAQLPALEPEAAAEYRVEWTRAGSPDRNPAGRRFVATAARRRPTGRRPAPRHAGGRGMAVAAALRATGWSSSRRSRSIWPPRPWARRPRAIGSTSTSRTAGCAGRASTRSCEPRGGDWMCIRPDGIGAVDIKITYRTSDGAVIFERRAACSTSARTDTRMVAAGRCEGAPPFYATPTWSTAHPDWAWLNRKQGIGFGRVVMSKLQVQCDLYLPDVQVRAPVTRVVVLGGGIAGSPPRTSWPNAASTS